ncbi:DUF4232 domain-containing protein [Streptomyces sp. NPDC005227]|uniref:DUF4232 domain-containing protein n=1 Tax=Streptomyces sp. NPDC005227 TaxID=3364707 RepID=UPI003698A0C3
MAPHVRCAGSRGWDWRTRRISRSRPTPTGATPGTPGTKTLTLKDGESAEAVVSWTHANTGTSQAVHAAYLEITPPAATRHKTLAFPEWVDNGNLSVTALAKHIDVSG